MCVLQLSDGTVHERLDRQSGLLRLVINGDCVGEARLERTVPRIFARETFDIGMDLNSPVGDYEAPFPFTGTLERVDIDLK